jgi:hypothetical protein
MKAAYFALCTLIGYSNMAQMMPRVVECCISYFARGMDGDGCYMPSMYAHIMIMLKLLFKLHGSSTFPVTWPVAAEY